MNRLGYRLAKIRNFFFCGIRKIVGIDNFRRKKYYGKKIVDIESANEFIYNNLMSDKPFLAARFGDAELRCLVYSLENKMKIRRGYPDYIKRAMGLNAGFFPCNDESLNEFGNILWESSKNVDIFGVWFNLLEDYVIHNTAPNSQLTYLTFLEPYRCKKPWSLALKGKKVLVVHPFKESIERQYLKRELLFEDENVLPEFSLIVYKAIQTNAGGTCEYSNWFDALNHMYEDIKKIDFDIAIIGCGSYGLPLAAKIKDLGKKVIHLAGATQILFGIRGARWDAKKDMQQYFNSNWIRPSSNEKPKNANDVEGGCYW